MAHDQVGRVVEERPVAVDTCRRLQVEGDPGVDAALAEVAVDCDLVAVVVAQTAEIGDVGTDALGRDGRVLPARPVVAARKTGDGPHRRLPHGPDPGPGSRV